jgi:hypothetical protein
MNIKEKAIFLHNHFRPIIKGDPHEVHPGLKKDSVENIIYFTLPVALNFQRDSKNMWISANKTFLDPETNYLFYPEQVVTKPFETIQKDLTKYKLALQKNKHVNIWITLSKTFNKYYQSNPYNLFKKYNFDILKILEAITKTEKDRFPYLRGPKLSNYWLYILNMHTNIPFKNSDKISIIVDTHIRQATEHLSLVKTNASVTEIEKVWFEILRETDLIPIQMHEVLWRWSRNNFVPKV